MKTFVSRTRVSSLALLLVGILSVGCTEKEMAPVAVTSVTLNTTSLELAEGDSYSLVATISPSNAANKGLIWSSSNSSVATVNNGVVTAQKTGTAEIVVKTEDGGKTATCTVTVSEKVFAVTGVTLDKESVEMTEGDEITLVATILPSNATNKNMTWSSSDSSVASVEDGKITAVGVGQAIITVTTEDGGKTATCNVTVNERYVPVTAISLDMTSAEITEGDEMTLTATINPDNATNKNIIWTSSNTDVATVSDGIVTALTPGQTTITATTEDGGMTATCEINVNVRIYPVESIELNQTQASLLIGDEMTLVATITPTNATDKTVTWSSSDPTVASVEDGQVKALKLGTAIITVTTQDGEKTASCTVSVVNIDSLVSAKFRSINIGNGSMTFEGSYVKLTAGVKMGVSIINTSLHDITVTGFSMICGLQNRAVEYTIEETELPGEMSLTLTVTITTTMYAPIAEFTYRYGDETYQVRVQYNGSF